MRLNPRTIEPFIDRALERIRVKNHELEYGAWLHGAYVSAAIGACFGKGAKYPDAPKYEGVVSEKALTDERADAELAALNMRIFAQRFNKKRKGGEPINGG